LTHKRARGIGSGLKTYLETGEPMAAAGAAAG
jgi:hypothetical protein